MLTLGRLNKHPHFIKSNEADLDAIYSLDMPVLHHRWLWYA